MNEKESGQSNGNLLEEMGNSVTIEALFSTYVLLNTFLSNEFINKAKTFNATMTRAIAREGLRQGYKLLLVATLDSYIDTVVRYPEIIGIEPDLDYRDYWAFTKGRGREITRGAIRTEHIISKYVAKANSMVKEILTLDSWENIEAFGGKTKEFRDCLRQISEKAYTASKDNREVSIGKALLESSIVILWSTSCNPLPLAHMYTDYFIGPKDHEPSLHSLDEMVAEYHLSSGGAISDHLHLDSAFFPRPLPSYWALGYSFSVHESLKLLASNNNNRVHMARLKSLDKLVHNTKHWADVEKYDSQMTSVYGPPRIFRGYSYSYNQVITDDDRLPLMTEVEELPSPERLLSIFGNRARIIERGSPAVFGSFECLLDGAIKRSKRTNEPTKVAIIVHKNHWGQEDYSTAIFMPAYGMFSNASMWWVFYLIGNNHSGGSSQRWRLVWSKIKRNRKNIDLTVVNANEEEFYKYCQDPGYTRLNEAVVLTNRITSEVRGAFPELLLANMLTNMGYTKVLNRFKPRILKSVKGELDTVGIKLNAQYPPHIMLFESKGQATDENALQQEVDHFSENVSIIQKKMKPFCNELEIPYAPNIEIEAIFVSMAVLGDENDNDVEEQENLGLLSFRRPRVNVPENIELWDYNKLLSMLRKYHVPPKYLELLKSVQVAIIL